MPTSMRCDSVSQGISRWNNAQADLALMVSVSSSHCGGAPNGALAFGSLRASNLVRFLPAWPVTSALAFGVLGFGMVTSLEYFSNPQGSYFELATRVCL